MEALIHGATRTLQNARRRDMGSGSHNWANAQHARS